MKSMTPTLRASALMALTAMAFTGCMTANERQNHDEGESEIMMEEAASMGEVFGTGAAAKVSADTLRGEVHVEPFRYDPACQGFVRYARFEGSRGYERERRDTVWLVDSLGIKLSVFAPLQAEVILHNRHVVHTKNGTQMDFRFNTELTWKLDGLTLVGIWNGTISGSFRGVEFKRGTITNVTRPYLAGRFRFPASGTIHVERWIYTVDLVFEGAGKATATITNTRNGNVHVVHIERR